MTMGWKSVEMQVAIPRTQDASNLQDQMSKQHQRFQDSLAQHQLREQLEKRKQVNKYGEPDELKNASDQDAWESDEFKKIKPLNDHEVGQEPLDHPYKGKHFDFIR